MSSKKFLKIVLGFSSLIILFIFVLNFIVDPLWLFNHSNKFNQKQGSYDERQLKSNYLYYNLKDNFDGILLGSSRATYVDQNDFENMKIFNYSVGAIQPYEYKYYIDFAKKIKGKELKYIIIASDFLSNVFFTVFNGVVASNLVLKFNKSPSLFVENFFVPNSNLLKLMSELFLMFKLSCSNSL